MELFEWTLGLLLAAVALTAVSRRIGAPYPALLALAGAALAFVPGARGPGIEPQLALALFIAPVLLDAAFDTSPRELKANALPLASLVLVAVLLTTAAVAWVGMRFAHLPLAAAVALGAIVAPPDAAAASAVLSQLRAPERMVQVLKGESLLNDAIALLIYRMAVIEATAGVSLAHATPGLVLGALGSPVVGYLLARAAGWLINQVEDAASSVVLQFVTAFGVWIVAERLGLSAIITTVVFAMTISQRSAAKQPARVRVSSYSVWEAAVFVLNVLAFALMGLQARPVLERLAKTQRLEALGVALAVLGTVVAVRLAYVLVWNAAVQLKNRKHGTDLPDDVRPPDFRTGLVVSWCGMRGLVTLAAAFALPREFPQRDLIVLCAFVVVLGTLVLQGFTLPLLLRWLKLEPDGVVERDVSKGRIASMEAALGALAGETSRAAEALRGELKATRRVSQDEDEPQAATEHDALRLRTLKARREKLHAMRRSGEIGDDAYHRLMEEADWDELSAAPAGHFQPLTT